MYIDLFAYSVTIDNEMVELVIEAHSRAHADILFGEWVAKNFISSN